MEQCNFKKHFKFHNFSEIFCCDMIRLRNTNLSVFLQCQYTRTILRNKYMSQSLFKKHSKFQNFDEIFHCRMTRLRNTILDVFIQCQYRRTILRNKNIGQSLFKKHSKFEKFDEILYSGMTRLRNVKLTAILKKENMGQNRFKNFSKLRRAAWYDLLKRITAKNENVGQTYLKKHLNYTILVKYCVMAISRNSNRFLMGIERSLSQKGIIKVYENIPIQP